MLGTGKPAWGGLGQREGEKETDGTTNGRHTNIKRGNLNSTSTNSRGKYSGTNWNT